MKERRIHRFDDLPDETLLAILGYLSPSNVLRAFYSNHPSDRFHCLILQYRTHVMLQNLRYSDFRLLVDHIFSHDAVSKLTLSNTHIPCLIDHFSSLRQDVPLMQLRQLRLDHSTLMTPRLLNWIAKQPKLESLSCDYSSYRQPPSTLTQRSLLRDFLFNDDLATSLRTLFITVRSGLALSNQLPSKVITHLRHVELDLDTFDDLCILLDKKFLLTVKTLLIYINRPRQCCM